MVNGNAQDDDIVISAIGANAARKKGADEQIIKVNIVFFVIGGGVKRQPTGFLLL